MAATDAAPNIIVGRPPTEFDVGLAALQTPGNTAFSSALKLLPIVDRLTVAGAADLAIAIGVDFPVEPRTLAWMGCLVVAFSQKPDFQFHEVQEIAVRFPGLDKLTRLPDSLVSASAGSAARVIRELAVAYAVNKVTELALSENQSSDDNMKHMVSVSRPLVSPYYIDVPVTPIDPTNLAGTDLTLAA